MVRFQRMTSTAFGEFSYKTAESLAAGQVGKESFPGYATIMRFVARQATSDQ